MPATVAHSDSCAASIPYEPVVHDGCSSVGTSAVEDSFVKAGMASRSDSRGLADRVVDLASRADIRECWTDNVGSWQFVEQVPNLVS